MQTFKIRPEGFDQIRKKTLLRSVPLTLLAVTAGSIIGSLDRKGATINSHTFIPLLIFVPTALVFGWRRGLKKQKAMLESYELTISDWHIRREQMNTPDISILTSEVVEILKGHKGGFAIKGRNNSTIIIPLYIENQEQLEATLQQIHPITIKTGYTPLQKLQFLLPVVIVALWICVFAVNNKLIVGVAGSLVTALLIWCLVTVQKSKNVDQKTKDWSWFILLPLVSLIASTIIKVFH